MSAAKQIAALERYLAVREPDEQTARALILEVEGDMDRLACTRSCVEAMLAPARLVVAHVDQVRAFVERAKRGQVRAGDLASAADAAARLIGDREAA